jgi:hypothetical protein
MDCIEEWLMLIAIVQMLSHMIVYLNHLEGFTKLTQTLFINKSPSYLPPQKFKKTFAHMNMESKWHVLNYKSLLDSLNCKLGQSHIYDLTIHMKNSKAKTINFNVLL